MSQSVQKEIEEGTFYELAQTWKAGENYRGWYEDPNCQEHRGYLTKAEQATPGGGTIRRRQVSAFVGAGSISCIPLTRPAWHNRAEENTNYHPPANANQAMWLAPWAAALTSHARSCLVIAQAARWFVDRDGLAHAELVDIDDDGEEELVIKNDQIFAVLAPDSGARLVYLFDLSGEAGRLIIGNPSDDWNLQEELNRYMDCPRNHPGALSDVGYEHNQYQATITESHGDLRFGSTQKRGVGKSAH